MKTYIALLRGINVGGKNILPMKELVVLLQNIGLEKVRTYIQSGNVVFRWSKNDLSGLSIRIGFKIMEKYGFEPGILLLEFGELTAAISENPFPGSEAEPESLHLGFLAGRPKKPNLKALEDLKKDSEQFRLKDRIFYLKAPEGVGRSKLAANAERLLGVPMTDRNWRTVCKIRDMAKEING